MNLPAAPTCPNCQFAIFNRRYPRCESCGMELPESLVYSPAQRHALKAADEEATAAKDRNARGDDGLPFSPFDAAIVSGLVALSDN